MLLTTTLAILLTAFLANPVSTAHLPRREQDWWQSAVIYQIYPRSFKDSDNSGTGDLQGIIEKLDHLVDAGITALWLSPIYKSPQVDYGYDISDFRDIDELFGNLAIFDELVAKAHEKGLKLVLDFVPNHSSNEHEWFGKSENRESGYEDYYVWKDGDRDTPPNAWTSYFHGPAWTYSEKRGQWYLHQFASGQPDLNYRNAQVVKEMKDVLTFWLDRGVDGFRVDIISALFEDPDFSDGPLEHQIYRNDQPETYDMVYQWRELLDNYQEEHGGETRVMMTESYADADKLFPYYGNNTHNGAHFAFNFWFITQLNRDSNARNIKSVIDKWFTNMSPQHTANWVLGNHDQHRVASRYGSERVDGLTMLAMLLPGVAVTYNGEEIGMENGAVTWEQGKDPQGCNDIEQNWESNSRDFERTPYQWDTTVNAGFNTGGETWLPVSEKYTTVNLAAQKVDNLKSHYRIYQEIVTTRRSETIKYGEHRILAFSDNVLGLTRVLNDNPTYVLLVNVGGQTETVDLSPFENLQDTLTVKIPSLQSNRQSGDNVQSSSITLTPYEALVLSEVSTSPAAGVPNFICHSLFFLIVLLNF